MATVKPLPAPHIPGNTEWERFDNAVSKLLGVPKDAFLKAEEKLKKAKAARKRRSNQRAASHA